MRGLRFLFFLLAAGAFAQTIKITSPLDESRRVTLAGTIHLKTRSALDLGPVQRSRPIGPLIVLLKRSPEQQGAIDRLLLGQRDHGSANFHQWLTPEQYADRFGLAEDDMSTVRSWLASHGLTIDHSARGRNWIGFSGTAEQIESTLGTQIHLYRSGSEEHYANATDISIPAALQPVVGGFLGLNDFLPNPRPHYTDNQNGNSLAPGDLATIYHITPLFNNSIDGTGQKLVIVGQSDLEANQADIRSFRQMFNLPGADPQVVLYGPDPGVTGALGEADFDLEWSASIARNPPLCTSTQGVSSPQASMRSIKISLQ
jgi:subtilase family serine protease